MPAFLTLGFRSRHLAYTWTPQPRHCHEHPSCGSGGGPASRPTWSGLCLSGRRCRQWAGGHPGPCSCIWLLLPRGRVLPSTCSTVTPSRSQSRARQLSPSRVLGVGARRRLLRVTHVILSPGNMKTQGQGGRVEAGGWGIAGAEGLGASGVSAWLREADVHHVIDWTEPGCGGSTPELWERECFLHVTGQMSPEQRLRPSGAVLSRRRLHTRAS